VNSTLKEINIFGMALMNVDWMMITEDNHHHTRMKEKWETAHISYAFNNTEPSVGTQL
jgi:hypothetical protein